MAKYKHTNELHHNHSNFYNTTIYLKLMVLFCFNLINDIVPRLNKKRTLNSAFLHNHCAYINNKENLLCCVRINARF